MDVSGNVKMIKAGTIIGEITSIEAIVNAARANKDSSADFDQELQKLVKKASNELTIEQKKRVTQLGSIKLYLLFPTKI